MRKVIVSMNLTLDGFMAGPDCELDWHFKSWSPDMAESLCEELSKADTILLGRITYKAMAKYWPSKAIDLSLAKEDIAFAEMMNNYSKVVFSKKQPGPDLVAIGWNNSKFVNGNTRLEILKLKQEPGKNIIIYGSGILVSTLMQMGLIDEYVLWIHPVVLGEGKPLFNSLHDMITLKLLKTKRFCSGVIVLYYRTVDKPGQKDNSVMEKYNLKEDY